MKKRRYKGALELARVQKGLGAEIRWEWSDQSSAWNLDFPMRKDARIGVKNTTTASGCALGVKYSRRGKCLDNSGELLPGNTTKPEARSAS